MHVWVCACVCVCLCTWAFVYVRARVSVCLCVCMCTCMWASVSISTRLCLWVRMHVCVCACVCVPVCVPCCPTACCGGVLDAVLEQPLLKQAWGCAAAAVPYLLRGQVWAWCPGWPRCLKSVSTHSTRQAPAPCPDNSPSQHRPHSWRVRPSKIPHVMNIWLKAVPRNKPPQPVSLSSPPNSKPPIPHLNAMSLIVYLNHWHLLEFGILGGSVGLDARCVVCTHFGRENVQF